MMRRTGWNVPGGQGRMCPADRVECARRQLDLSHCGICTGHLAAIFFKKKIGDISHFRGATDTPVLDFWCPRFQSQGGPLACFLACVILRFTSGVTPADCTEVSIAASLFDPHTYTCVCKYWWRFRPDIFTACVRSTREGNIFSLSVHTSRGAGVPTFQVVGYLPSQIWTGGGVPTSGWGGTYLPRSGRGGYVLLGGYLPSQVG